MTTELVKKPNKNKTKLPKELSPLLKGETATMVVNDPTMRRKKRTGTPTLLISPVSVYGLPGNDLLLSMPGYGCEVVTPGSIKMIQLFRLGLTVKAAKVLAITLNTVFTKQ